MNKIIKTSNIHEDPYMDENNMNMSINRSIKYNITELNNSFNILLKEYNKNFYKIKNTKFDIYNYLTGINIIINVFHITLLKSRNLNLTNFHTQKAIYYYTEFLEQIYDNNNKFLKLTTKEAVLFVYKKTVFELESPNNKLSKNSIIKLMILKEITNIYTLIISHYIYTCNSGDDYQVFSTKICSKLFLLFNLKKKIKYDIFYKNLVTLFNKLSELLCENNIEESLDLINEYFNEKHITNRLLE